MTEYKGILDETASTIATLRRQVADKVAKIAELTKWQEDTLIELENEMGFCDGDNTPTPEQVGDAVRLEKSIGDVLADQVADLQAANETLNALADSMKVNGGKTLRELAEAQRTVAMQRDELLRLQGEIAGWMGKLAEANYEIERLHNTFGESRPYVWAGFSPFTGVQVVSLLNENTALRIQRDSLRAQLAAAHSNVDGYAAVMLELTAARAEVAELKRAIAEASRDAQRWTIVSPLVRRAIEVVDSWNSDIDNPRHPFTKLVELARTSIDGNAPVTVADSGGA